MDTFADADDWYARRECWHEEVAALRVMALEAGLTETLKWRHPCYMAHGKNVLIIGVRKAHAVASFLSGSLIDDPQGRLVQPGQDRSVRYLPLDSLDQVQADRAYLETLLVRAIEVARLGLRVEPLPDDFEYVEELQERLSADPEFAAAFEALTPGRRRGYNLHFGRAKQSATRESRITASTERILLGKGHMDCICGRSKHKPRCDGTHRTPA